MATAAAPPAPQLQSPCGDYCIPTAFLQYSTPPPPTPPPHRRPRAPRRASAIPPQPPRSHRSAAPRGPAARAAPCKSYTSYGGGGGDRWKNDLSPGTRTILSHGNIGIYLIPGNSARVSPFISSPEFCKSFISFCAANQLRFSCTVPILHAHHTAANASAPPHPLPVLTVQKAERAP